MIDKPKNQYESDTAETLFHDLATPLLIAKMKASLLASHLPQLMKLLSESPQTRHLLPENEKVIEALISAPDIMVSNLELVQKKINLLSESLLLQANNFSAATSVESVAANIQKGGLASSV